MTSTYKNRLLACLVLSATTIPFGLSNHNHLGLSGSNGFASAFAAIPAAQHTSHKPRVVSQTKTYRGGTTSTVRKMSASPFFNISPFWKSSQVFAAINAAGFVINVLAPKCHYHVDLFGTGAFAAAALTTISSPDRRIRWSSAAVAAWSTKLAGFLLFRVFKNGHDARLDANLSTPTGAFGFWFISFLWGITCSLPHALGTTSSVPVKNPYSLYAGAGIFGLGLAIETLADYQKWMFKEANPGKFCNVGIWSISQHPNWFGNLLLWSGIWVMNAPSLVDPSAKGLWKYQRPVLALLGPLFMWTLFDAQATGKILGDSLAANHKRYSESPSFADYLAKTPLIIPNPLRWFRS